jgi:hypothetical protein
MILGLSKSGLNKRSGVILFVVLGAIFVLTTLILSYNHLVRGKYNEHREILNHMRGLKYAQAINRFVIAKLKADLAEPLKPNEDTPGRALRTKVFIHNDDSKLSSSIQEEWLSKIDFQDFLQALLGELTIEDAIPTVEITFSRPRILKDRKTKTEFFLDFEKEGKMTISTTVNLGRSKETWVETRPYRVIVPYPMPITKFTMYLSEATGDHDPVKFNTVVIEAANNGRLAQGSSQPLILNNGKAKKGANRDPDVYKERGWIHLGGGNLLLNRAAGKDNFGQRYHSYSPMAEVTSPIALTLNFKDGHKIPKINQQSFQFSMAKWGFADSIINGPSAKMWKGILKYYLKKYKPSKKKKWWQSSCLHLFGKNTDTGRSITRVTGNVNDRFLEFGYIIPDNGAGPMGAVIGINKEKIKDFEKYSGKKRVIIPPAIKDVGKFLSKKVSIDNCLVLPNPKVLKNNFAINELNDSRELRDFFKDLPFNSVGNNLSFYKIMSKPDFCSYEETYNMIAQYSKNKKKIGIPPSPAVPKTDTMDFQENIYGKPTDGLKIDKIFESPLMGMDKRVCYEISAKNSKTNLFKEFKEAFCSTSSGKTKTNDFDLKNAVVRINTGGKGLKTEDNLGTHTGGSILIDGPVTVGAFRNQTKSVNAPVLILAEKGDLTISNGKGTDSLGYFIAPKGQIKALNKHVALKVIGGIAAKTIMPDQISGGGQVIYNENLDPTSNGFGNYVGIVIGPAGGD